MVQVKTVEEFYKTNHKELLKSIHYIRKFPSKEDVEEISQNFYLCIIKSRTLEKYNPLAGASFSTYIWKVLKWMVVDNINENIKDSKPFEIETSMPKKPDSDESSKPKAQKYENTTACNDRVTMDLEEEVWSKIGEFDGQYKFSPSFVNSFVSFERGKEILESLEDFKFYLMSLKEKDKKKKNMVKYIELIDFGLKGTDIADNFVVSDTMVKNIRKDVQRHYEKWKKTMSNPVLSEFCS